MSEKSNSFTRSNKKVTMLNVALSLLYELVYVAYGFIVPRLILGAFGSEVNGLVSSITQFLSLITILEGGVGGVIKASLYKPLANHDDKKLSAVYNAASKFYKKIALFYVLYGLTVAIVYPLIFKTVNNWQYTFALVLIIASQTFIQYFFSINLRTLLLSDRRGFIVSIVSIVMQVISLAVTVVIVQLFPDILLLKAVGSIVFILQPVVYSLYARRHYNINKNEPPDRDSLKQRWNSFGHNLAFFIHNNTDIVLLTIMGTLFDVSVYSVYFMIVNALRTLVASVSNAISPTMGNIMASGDKKRIDDAFDLFNFSSNTITTFAFTCGAVLITPFVSIFARIIKETVIPAVIKA